MPEDTAHFPPQDAIAVGLRGLCPRCGQGRMFGGFLSLKPACGNCGLDLAFADSADGPAVFVILIVGFVVAGAALGVELAWAPPIWLHVVLWGPLVLILALGLLRPLKGIMVALQYVNRAREGRLEPGA